MDKIKLIIKDCREYLKNYGEAFITEEELILIEKRIKELEEALLKVKDKNTTLFITCRNSIPKQKVKDKIKEIKEDKESKYFDTFLMARDINYAIEILEELLEDK